MVVNVNSLFFQVVCAKVKMVPVMGQSVSPLSHSDVAL